MRKITLAFCLAALSCLFVVSPSFGATSTSFAIPADPPSEEQEESGPPGANGGGTEVEWGDNGPISSYPRSMPSSKSPDITATLSDAFLHLMFKKTISCTATIKNSAGVVVYSQALSAQANSNVLIPTENLSADTYFISFSNRGGMVLLQGKFHIIK